jgi:hypothetical protein
LCEPYALRIGYVRLGIPRLKTGFRVADILKKMTIFVVFATSNPGPEFDAAVAARFPGDHLKVKDGEWLISTEGTAKDVSDSLGISAGTPSGGIVVAISGYFGRTSTSTWEWIRVKWQELHGGVRR